MCDFMSVCSDGKGKLYYFGAAERKRILEGKPPYESADSHTSIADFYGFRGKDEDKLNKYEWNPITNELKIDKMNARNDNEKVKKALLKLDFKKVVPELVIKKIVNPFQLEPPEKITRRHILLLREWASVRASVWNSVGDSVWDSMWNSVGDSVRDSVWDSVWDSMEAYIGSFFRLPRKKWKYTEKIKAKGYPFQPAIGLWMQGLVPSFDGRKWRLHGGKDAKILFEISKEELEAKG